MTANIYVNGRNINDIPKNELAELKRKITDKFADAMGYKRIESNPLQRVTLKNK